MGSHQTVISRPFTDVNGYAIRNLPNLFICTTNIHLVTVNTTLRSMHQDITEIIPRLQYEQLELTFSIVQTEYVSQKNIFAI